MSTGLKANVDGSAAIQVGGTDVITLTSGGAATFVTSPTTVQAGTAAAPSITFSGDTNTGIYSPGADTIAFTEGGVESARFNSAGNFGLGVTPSAWASGWKAIDMASAGVAGNGIQLQVTSNAFSDGSNWIYKTTNSASMYQQVAGVHTWFNAPSGTAGNAITFTQSLSLGRGTSLALEGATSQSGTGITFPAAQSASSNANTLDDYEEGTWNAVLTYSTTLTNTSPSTQTTLTGRGLYTKVGNICTVSVYVDRTDIGSNFILSTISGLPFTSFTSGGTGAAVTASLYLIKAQYGATDITNPVSNCQVNPNNASFATLLANNNTGSGYLTFVIGSQALFTTTYRVA